MNRVYRYIKNNSKLILGLIIGEILAGGGAFAAILIQGKNVTYSNTSTELVSTNAQGALEEVKDMVNGNFLSAYTYSDNCITGDESRCFKNLCYRTKTANSCKTGDIITYRVNDSTILRFHVMYDSGSTITMQTQKTIIYNTPWISGEEYSAGPEYGNDKGPLTLLSALESVTAGWSNVENQTYQMGITSFVSDSNIDAYTGCIIFVQEIHTL